MTNDIRKDLAASLALVAAMLVMLVVSNPAEAQSGTNPFTGVNWDSVVRNDPRLKIDDQGSRRFGHPYVAYVANNAFFGYPGFGVYKVQTGRIGNSSQWVAAVPLHSGGTMGLSGVLVYLPNAHSYLKGFAGALPAFHGASLYLFYRWHTGNECNACDTHTRVEQWTFRGHAMHEVSQEVITNAELAGRYCGTAREEFHRLCELHGHS